MTTKRQPTTGDAILALRVKVVEAYEKANADKITRPGAFGYGAKVIQDTLECDFRVACMLMDCWVTEHHVSQPQAPP